jgi:hypothetical protein
MNSFFQFVKNNGQFLVIILALSASGIGWVFKKLTEQAIIRRAQADQHRRVEEMLRTGRDPGAAMAAGRSAGTMAPTAAEARERLADLARRRQAQMDQLRRQGRSNGSDAPARTATTLTPPTSPSTSPAPSPLIIMGPHGPITIPRPPSAPAPTASPRTAGFPTRSSPVSFPPARPATPPPPSRPAPRQAKPQTRPAAKRRVPQSGPRSAGSPASTTSRSGERRTSDSAPDRGSRPITPGSASAASLSAETPADRPRVVPVGPRPTAAALRLPPVNAGSAAEYRRVLAMIELLSPPIALREGPGPTASSFG